MSIYDHEPAPAPPRDNETTLSALATAMVEAGAKDIYNVRVPEGGFLAVILKGSILSGDTHQRLSRAMSEAVPGIKTLIFGGDVTFVGVGPEAKVPA